MKAYMTNGNKKFHIVDDLPADDALIKVKISSIFPIADDISVYEGKFDLEYPIVPCGIATAIVSEDYVDHGLKRGEKVIINPYIRKEEKEESFLNVARFGFDKNGFLCDFTAIPIDNIIPFPEGIKDDEAIFANTIALALSVINNMILEEGSYVALVGDSILNLILAQLLRYYRIIPIFISRDDRYSKLAKKAGCYFVINETKDNVTEKVFEITGGRLAKHTIFNLNTGISTNFLHLITGYGGDCIITNASHGSFARVSLDIGGILSKRLVIKGISEGKDEFPSAVNMLAQKQLSLTDMIDVKFNLDDVPILFATLSKAPTTYMCPIIKV